jgi:hypothetical protein
MDIQMTESLKPETTNHQYPKAFNLYHPSLQHPHHFVLAEHEERPIFAVTTHSVFSSHPDVELHSGPTDDSPVAASYDIKRFSLTRFASLPGGGSGAAPVREQVRRRFRTFAFEADVPGADGSPRRERFEWRRTRSGDAPGVGLNWFGHKLVRLAAGGERGEEVVALCSGPGSAYTGSKVFKFEFVGDGASGTLGERWATVAVITGLGQWMEDVRRRLLIVYIFACVI